MQTTEQQNIDNAVAKARKEVCEIIRNRIKELNEIADTLDKIEIDRIETRIDELTDLQDKISKGDEA